MDDEKAYGVIVEWKDEGPLVMESQLMTYDEAYNRKATFVDDKRVIRVAMFKAIHISGNETLLPKENDDGK